MEKLPLEIRLHIFQIARRSAFHKKIRRFDAKNGKKITSKVMKNRHPGYYTWEAEYRSGKKLHLITAFWDDGVVTRDLYGFEKINGEIEGQYMGGELMRTLHHYN